MPRLLVLTLCLLLSPAVTHAVSLKGYELTKTLQNVAEESSVGTPRSINEDIMDMGYTAEGNQLINHLTVRPEHAEKMRANPEQVRSQLGDSVCNNEGYRQLLSRGAILTYQFVEQQTDTPIMIERFDAGSCLIELPE